jgi:beta-N-acetylhexosaminidase
MMAAMTPAIVGLSGPVLLAEEAALLRRHAPAGVILFARNVIDPAQLATLVAALRAVLPAKSVLMVDQEGGRVARLKPPHWDAHPPAAAFGAVFARDAQAGLRCAFAGGALIGLQTALAGFDLVAAPVLDLAWPGAHGVIGDRSFGAEPEAVGRLGRAFAAGMLAAGVQPIGKHAPGHGRATADSHLSLPVVEAPLLEAAGLDADLLPFALNADLPWAMTAHILYPAWDGAFPATLSATVIDKVIRGRIGFQGVLVTDDLAMRALMGTPLMGTPLTGTPADNARAALLAGCDIALYCAGDLAPTEAVLAACPPMTDATARRLASARALAASRRVGLDAAFLTAERDRLLAS